MIGHDTKIWKSECGNRWSLSSRWPPMMNEDTTCSLLTSNTCSLRVFLAVAWCRTCVSRTYASFEEKTRILLWHRRGNGRRRWVSKHPTQWIQKSLAQDEKHMHNTATMRMNRKPKLSSVDFFLITAIGDLLPPFGNRCEQKTQSVNIYCPSIVGRRVGAYCAQSQTLSTTLPFLLSLYQGCVNDNRRRSYSISFDWISCIASWRRQQHIMTYSGCQKTQRPLKSKRHIVS